MRDVSRARRVALLVSATLLASIGAVATTATPGGAALPACTKTWTNTTGGSWDVGASWSGGTVPTATDHVCITAAGTYTVTLADPGVAVTVASLRVGASSGAGTQTLLVDRGVQTDATSLTATQGIEITLSGALVLGETADTQVSVGVGDGALIANGGAIGQEVGVTRASAIRGDVVNTGNLRLDAPLFVEGDLTNEGLLQDNHVLHVEGTMWTKGGTINGEWVIVAYDGLRVGDAVIGSSEQRPGFIIEGGELSFESDQRIDVTVRHEVTVEGDTSVNQTIVVQSVDGVDTTLTFDGTWTSRGGIYLQPEAGADVMIVGAGAGATLVSANEMTRFDDDGAGAIIDADVVNQGLLGTGDGVIDVTGDLTNEDTLGLQLGEVTVGGDLVLGPNGLVTHDVDNGASGDSGHLTVTGDASVDGTLFTDTAAAPEVGSGPTVITAATRSGTFVELAFTGSASYDAQYTATAVNLVRRASESTTRRFVRAAFQDFLSRQPTAGELASRATAIDGGTLTRATLVRQLSQSNEYVTALIQRFYADTLGRPGDAAGVAFWVGELRSGRRTVAEVAGSFYASGEYFTRAGGTNAAWIADLYDVFFERPPTGGDLTYWTTRIAARGRTRVAIELFQSLESRRQRVQRLYHDLLGRDGDPAGVDYWAGRITTGGDLALAVDLASSLEYRDRAITRYP